MAGRISGITIEIGGDTTKLQSALKGVDKTLKTTQSNLKDINKLLKMDPGNVELLTQKQKNLKTAIQATKDRLKELKDAQSGVKEGTAEWDSLQREIIATEQDLSKLKDEYRNFGSVAKQVVQEAGHKMQEFGEKISGIGQKFAPISKAAAGLVAGMGAMGNAFSDASLFPELQGDRERLIPALKKTVALLEGRCEALYQIGSMAARGPSESGCLRIYTGNMKREDILAFFFTPECVDNVAL